MNNFIRRALESEGALNRPAGEIEIKGPVGVAFSEALAKAFPKDPEEGAGLATESFRDKIKKCSMESDQFALMRLAGGINTAMGNSEATDDVSIYMTSPETMSEDDVTDVSNDLINLKENGSYIVVVDATNIEKVNDVDAAKAGVETDTKIMRIETALEALTVSMKGKFIKVK